MDVSQAQRYHYRRQSEEEENPSPYNYTPTGYVCEVFLVLFAITTIAHLVQSIKRRMWFLIPTMVFCGLSEIIGWSGRYWSAKSPTLMDPFMMQITTTIIAPTFMTAAMFVTLSRIITEVGTQFSRLRPKYYTIIFITADVVALVVQSVGGATASGADTPEGAENGANIMVGGIIVQMVAITIYVILAAEYLLRVHNDRPLRPASDGSEEKEVVGCARLTRNLQMMLIGLAISTLFIYVRSVYRTIELLDGWEGKIISNERLFNLLDGTPIFLAMFTLNIFHPGRLLPAARTESSEKTSSEKIESV